MPRQRKCDCQLDSKGNAKLDEQSIHCPAGSCDVSRIFNLTRNDDDDAAALATWPPLRAHRNAALGARRNTIRDT